MANDKGGASKRPSWKVSSGTGMARGHKPLKGPRVPDVWDPLWYLKGSNTDKPGEKKNLPGKPTAPTTASSGGGGGYGGGGGSATEGLSQYIQYYRLHYFPNGKPPAKLLQKAKDNNWSLDYFAQRVRMEDPKYLQSNEVKAILPAFQRTMKQLFPGLSSKKGQAALMKSPFYKKTAVWYLRGGYWQGENGGAAQLFQHITNTKMWNTRNPYWKAYSQNPDVGVTGERDPLVYKQLMSALQSSFKNYGMDLPEDYYRSFFKSRYATGEGIKSLASNLDQLATQQGSFQWMEGRDLTGKEKKQELFGTSEAATDLRGRLARSFGLRRNFLSSEQTGASTTVNNRNQLIKPLL